MLLLNCGFTSRYVVDDELQVQAFIEEPSSKAITSRSPDFSNTELPWLPDVVKDFVFPAGFPGD